MMAAGMDRKTYVLAVAMALLLLIGGAWPRPALPTYALHDGASGYFWRSGASATLSTIAAQDQASRVAHERGLSQAFVAFAIARSTHNDTYNLSARPQVDVAELNLRLDGKL